MTKFISYTFYALLILQNTSALAIEKSNEIKNESRYIVLNYDIYSEGEDVGDVTTKISLQDNRHVIIEQSHIKMSGWWWSIDFITIMSEEFENGNELVKADSKTFDEGVAYWTKIKSQENGVWMQYIKIPETNPEEEKKFAKLAFEIEGKTSANTENILLLSESIFADRHIGGEEGLAPKNSFDTTWNNLPFYIQRMADNRIPGKLKILDTENLEIDVFTVEEIGRETLMIGAEKISTHHLAFSNAKTSTSHIWINTDKRSIPCVVRHTGEDEDGPFEIVIKSINL